jgi:hypothetical protein
MHTSGDLRHLHLSGSQHQHAMGAQTETRASPVCLQFLGDVDSNLADSVILSELVHIPNDPPSGTSESNELRLAHVALGFLPDVTWGVRTHASQGA